VNNERPPPRRQVQPENVLRVRLGHGANCSSIGSVVDTLFATAVVGTALFAAVVAALSKESVNVSGRDEHPLDVDRSGGGST
jgi:hypothetical protein